MWLATKQFKNPCCELEKSQMFSYAWNSPHKLFQNVHCLFWIFCWKSVHTFSRSVVNRQTDRETDRQRDRHIDRQKDRWKRTRRGADFPKFTFWQECLFDRVENQQGSVPTQDASLCHKWCKDMPKCSWVMRGDLPSTHTIRQTNGQTNILAKMQVLTSNRRTEIKTLPVEVWR